MTLVGEEIALRETIVELAVLLFWNRRCGFCGAARGAAVVRATASRARGS